MIIEPQCHFNKIDPYATQVPLGRGSYILDYGSAFFHGFAQVNVFLDREIDRFKAENATPRFLVAVESCRNDRIEPLRRRRCPALHGAARLDASCCCSCAIGAEALS